LVGHAGLVLDALLAEINKASNPTAMRQRRRRDRRIA